MELNKTSQRLAACCAVTISLAGCGAGAAHSAVPSSAHPTILTLAAGPSGDGGVKGFVDRVGKLSSGTLRIDVQGGRSDSGPDWETRLLTDVQAGRVQLGVTASRAFDTIGIKDFTALQAPMLIDSRSLEQRVIASPIADNMLKGLSSHGLVGVGLWAGDLRRPFGITRALVTASDYKGARIAIAPSKTTEAIIRALGATPVTDATDQADGEEAHILQIASGQPHGTVTSNVVLQARPSVLVMNPAAWGALPTTSRDVLTQAAHQYASIGFVTNEAPYLAELCRDNVAFLSATDEQLASLRTAFQPVYKQLRFDPRTKLFIDQISALKAGGSSPDVLPPCSARQPSPSEEPTGSPISPSALNGAYQYVLTQAAADAFGPPATDPGNVYPLVVNIELRDGAWRGLNGDPGLVGTYTATSNRIVFTWPQTNTTFSVTYVRDADGTLHQTPVRPMDIGDQFMWTGAPWRRVGPPGAAAK